MDISEEIKKIKARSGKTGRELAILIGTTEATFWNYLKGNTPIPAEKMDKLRGLVK